MGRGQEYDDELVSRHKELCGKALDLAFELVSHVCLRGLVWRLVAPARFSVLFSEPHRAEALRRYRREYRAWLETESAAHRNKAWAQIVRHCYWMQGVVARAGYEILMRSRGDALDADGEAYLEVVFRNLGDTVCIERTNNALRRVCNEETSNSLSSRANLQMKFYRSNVLQSRGVATPVVRASDFEAPLRRPPRDLAKWPSGSVPFFVEDL